MNSNFARLFLALQQKLESITVIEDNAEKQALRFIAAELGQLENYPPGGRPPVSFPCGLIDIDNAAFNEWGNNGQIGVITVKIRLGFDPYSSTSNLTPAEYRNKALFYYELEHALYKKLQGWSPQSCVIKPAVPANPPDQEEAAVVIAEFPDVFGHLVRTGAKTEERADLLRVRTLTFTLGIEDFSASPDGPINVPAVMEIVELEDNE